MTKVQKIILGILYGISALLICEVLFYCVKIHELKAVLTQRTAIQQELEQKKDSVYQCFTSADLKMADVKGFVHTIEYKEVGPNECAESGSFMNVSLVFDKQGNIVDVKAQYRLSDLYTATIERNDEGQIASIAVRTSYTNGANESYLGYVIRHLTYDADGHMSRLLFEDQSDGGAWGTFVDEDLNFSDYQEGKGTTKFTADWNDGMHICHQNGQYTDFENDEMGNWIARTADVETTTEYIDEEDSILKETSKLKESRVITYYTKEELDFTPYLK